MNIKNISVLDIVNQYGIDMKDVGYGQHSGRCPICGNSEINDNGERSDRFTVFDDTNRWLCRRAKDDGVHDKYHGDATDLVMAVEGVGFKAAITIIQNKKFKTIEFQENNKQLSFDKESEFSEEYWNRIVEKGAVKLWQTTWAKEYLHDRGFTDETITRFKLGCGTRLDINSILIPYYGKYINTKKIHESGYKLVAGKYRILDGALRYAAWKNTALIDKLYGSHAHRSMFETTCFVVEGEFNCMSLDQCFGEKVDCWSTGSENFKFTDDNIARISKYKKIFLWCDNKTTLKQWMEIFPNARGLISEDVGGDANELLVKGILVKTVQDWYAKG